MKIKCVFSYIIYIFLLIFENNAFVESFSCDIGFVKELHFSEDLGSISTSDPEVIDLTVTAKDKIMVKAKKSGISIVQVKNRNEDLIFVQTFKVTNSIDDIKIMIKELYPDLNIGIKQYNDLIVLKGIVRFPKQSADIENFVTKFFEKKEGEKVTILNKLHIDEVAQVMVKVKIVEIDRSAAKQFGFLWNEITKIKSDASNKNSLNACLTNSGTFLVGEGKTLDNVYKTFDSGVISTWKYKKGEIVSDILSVLAILENENIAVQVASPTLIAVVGNEATFNAGGTDYYHVQNIKDGIKSEEIQGSDYGITLKFTPYIYSDGMIKLSNFNIDLTLVKPLNNGKLSSEVRSVTTNLEIANGQTIAVAGLLKRSIVDNSVKSTFLGSLPLIGDLFSQRIVQNDEKEVVVVVTPYLVNPVNDRFYATDSGISKKDQNDDCVNDNVTIYDDHVYKEM